jgi:hypothetical protein
MKEGRKGRKKLWTERGKERNKEGKKEMEQIERKNESNEDGKRKEEKRWRTEREMKG